MGWKGGRNGYEPHSRIPVALNLTQSEDCPSKASNGTYTGDSEPLVVPVGVPWHGDGETRFERSLNGA